ncbi:MULTISPECIES: UDP-N-acetylmuramoylalanyl-D-glutamyl-2,6-diaminopimelate--D-alanyl-D-alanine ligase [Rhodomicrobium]|uniref:UDP-N-acetylmuramoylalanyl-D-glutamyl-2, 6-diaminopimelate--D-alanyl-D-alanine ligase n=1 Tax=Rhodomicrobium TaxID=1068 RepID=UPI000B4B43CA|nr:MULTISPECIES: UDP-N-acetylmuramoylalanyl-D-glutamyl-2,6-diaminopimelate--D-alanyl-D-alanine ligase [Rhodomicrobium]
MAEALWTAAELTETLGAAEGGAMPDSVGGISIDTRTLEPGDLFFAIKGDRTDGHNYLAHAFAAGAGLAVVNADYAGKASGPLLRVRDTLEALNTLGRAGRARSKARIVAVTGSVGKTGTKEMLRLMLGKLGRVHASDKSYNNHWGVPLSLARLPRDADYAVFEIGMNHPGEITPLTHLVRPHAAIITTIAPVHIEFFDGIEAIADAKAEIFDGLEPDGAAILNRDIEQYDRLAQRAGERGAARIVGFGWADEAEARLLASEAEGGGSRIEADCLGERLSYHIGAPGEHLAMNSLGAVAAIKLLGGDVARAVPALAVFGAPAGRGAQSLHAIEGGTFLLLDESYNANPASVTAAIRVLGDLPQSRAKRRIAVLGDMLELGERSDAMHAGLAAAIEAAEVDALFCCGPHMAALFAALPEAKRGAWAENSESLKQALFEAIQPGDAVTIKGSLGSRMGLLVEAIKQRYPQREAAETGAAE